METTRPETAPVLIKHPMMRRLEALSRNHGKVSSMRRRLERRETADELVRRLIVNGVCTEETAAALLEGWGGQEAVMEETWKKLAEAAELIERYDLPLDMYWGQVEGGSFEIDVTRSARAVRVVMWTGHLPRGVSFAKLLHDRGYFDELDQLRIALERMLEPTR
jgi:hypothetical protein